MPTARPRFSPSKAALSKARLLGSSSAAPTPCAARAASRTSRLGRERADEAGGGEQAGADDQQAAPAIMVAERAAEQEQRRQRQEIGVDHPLHVGRAGAVAGADRGQRDVEHAALDERQARGEDAGGERPARVVRARLLKRRDVLDRRGGVERDRPSSASTRRAATTSHSDSTTRQAATSAAAIGLAMASASSPPVATSSPVETAMLLNGSGLALTRVRAPALPAWAIERRAAAEQEAGDLPAGVAAIDDREAEQARRRAAG